MVEFSFDGMFRTNEKGIPDTSSLDPHSFVSTEFFFTSLILQIMICLMFIGLFGMSVFRSMKKIKNEDFNADINNPEDESEGEQEIGDKDSGDKNQNTNDNLIYRFDEDEQEKEKEENDNDNKEADAEEDEDAEEEDDYNDIHDINEKQFLEIDRLVLFFQPFLVVFIICNNTFSVDPITIVAFILTTAFFGLFNLKGICEKVKVTQMLFIVPSVVAYASFFLSDIDMTT